MTTTDELARILHWVQVGVEDPGVSPAALAARAHLSPWR